MFIKKKVEELVTPAVEEAGCELVDIEYVTENKRKILRLLIDKRDGVSIDDCADVSQAVEMILDEEEPVDGPYDLEVSSPGIDRPIITDKDLRRNTGRIVEIVLKQHIDKRIRYEGILDSFSIGSVTIVLDEPFVKGVKPKTNGKVIEFERAVIKSIRRAIRF